MPTSKPRINITVTDEFYEKLKLLAAQSHTTVAGFGLKLMEEAIEMYEDKKWSEIGEERLKQSSGEYEDHDEVWSHLDDEER